MVQLPSELVTTVWLWPPLPVVVETLDDTLPPPEFMVTELPPLVWAVTLPPPAVTELDSAPSLDFAEASRSTILQFLSVCGDAGSAQQKRGARQQRERNQTNGVHGSTPCDEEGPPRGRRPADELEPNASLARGPCQLLLLLFLLLAGVHAALRAVIASFLIGIVETGGAGG